MSDEKIKLAAELALSAKRRSSTGSSQLTGIALELFLHKKPFELERIIRGEEEVVAEFSEQKFFDPNDM